MNSMNRRFDPLRLIALALVMGLPGLAMAQEQALPPAREVLDRFVDAVGGEDVVRKPKSFEMTGEFSMPGSGISGSLGIYSMAPNLQLVSLEIPGIGKMQEGFDGELAWSVDPTMGPRIKDGSELAQTTFNADFYAVLHLDNRYKSMETLAKTEFGDSTCFKLRLVTTNDDEIFEYFDVDTGLLTGMERTGEAPVGRIKTSQTAGDYREFAGQKMPTRIVVSVGPIEQVLKINDIKVDTVEKSIFEPPAEIRTLAQE